MFDTFWQRLQLKSVPSAIRITLHKKIKFSISKCNQIRSFLWIWSHLLKKSFVVQCKAFYRQQCKHISLSAYPERSKHFLINNLLTIENQVT